MMGPYLLAVVGIAVYAIVAILWQSNRQANQTSHLLAHMAQLQASHARERWELCTRIQAPQIAASGAVGPPPMPDPAELLATLGVLQPSVPEPEGNLEDDGDDMWADESHLVGTGPVAPAVSEIA